MHRERNYIRMISTRIALPVLAIVACTTLRSAQPLTTFLTPGIPSDYYGSPITLTAQSTSTAKTLSIQFRKPDSTGADYSITANLAAGTVDLANSKTSSQLAVSKCAGALDALKISTCAVKISGSTATFTVTLVRDFAAWDGKADILLKPADSDAVVASWYPPALTTRAAASRFLEHAAFGPRPSDTAEVMRLGLKGWIDQQFENPASEHLFYFDPKDPAVRLPYYPEAPIGDGDPYTDPKYVIPKFFSGRFLRNAVMNSGPGINDQLRQRVAFALSQFFVVNYDKIANRPARVAPFQEMLYKEAFTSFGKLLTDVTLSPVMGDFLDLAGSVKASPATKSTPAIGPNENYPREILQLFSIGTYMLDMGGKPIPDKAGNPTATYNQDTVTAFAQAMSGWDYASSDRRYLQPMVASDNKHERSVAKKLLNGTVLPARQSAKQDMEGALNNILAHQNVAPFFSKFLIQHLVTSNPSTDYVARVAKVFQDQKGDMKEVLRAVLLDREARAADDPTVKPQPGFGHLREPLLWVASFLRAFNATVTDGTSFGDDFVDMGQIPYNPPSVFNYYSPTYQVGSQAAPEFELHSPWVALFRANLPFVEQIFSSGNYAETITPELKGTAWSIDIGPYYHFSNDQAGDRALVKAFDTVLMHDAMPAEMSDRLVRMLGNLRTTYPKASIVERPSIMAYLIITSSYFQVMH